MNARDARNMVLVVDDEPQVLTAIQDTLEREFHVLVETSGQAAIKVLENVRDLSVILSDQRMPGMSGDEFLAKAREISEATRVMITGFADLEAVIRAVNLGKIFGYISKPWNPELLKLLIYKAVEHYRLQQDLHEEQRLLRNLMHNIPDAIFFKDLEHRYLRVNGAQARRLLLGTPSDAVGKRAAEILPGEQAEQWEKRDAEVLESGVALTDWIEKFEKAPGRVSWFSVTKAPVRDEKGRIVSLVGIARDITERKEAEEKIRRLNRVYAMLSGINTLIVRVRDRRELFREACRIAVKHGGFEIAWIGLCDPQTLDVTPVEWAGIEADDFLATQKASTRGDVPQGQGAIGRAVRERHPVWVNDIAAALDGAGARRKELARRGFRSVIALPLIVEGAEMGILGLYTREPNFFNEEEVKLLTELAGDISFALEVIGKEEKLNYLAYYDALTDLPNRSLFLDRVGQMIRAVFAERPNVAVIRLDLDRFAMINESLGLNAGDALLRETAARLARVFGAEGSVARVGGDSFAVALPGKWLPEAAAHAYETYYPAVFGEPIDLGKESLNASATVGVAFYPGDGGDPDTLFANAEAALNRAKASKAGILFYGREMNARVAETLALENKLRRALEKDQFVLHYQPKIELASGRISGLEGLIRWNNPELGLVPPAKFIPLLEDTGMILQVGRWVIRQALAHHREWRTQGVPAPRIAVNISPIQLRQKDFVDVVRGAIGEFAAGPAGLDVEITESLLMQDIEVSIEKLAAIRDMGVNIAIDDFGTGYSSLGYLAKLPVNALKIDRSFIATMASSPDSMSIVSTIISLAHSLKLKVIAEGVDSEEQSNLLRLLKCDEIQGYLITKPLPAADMAVMLSERGGA